MSKLQTVTSFCCNCTGVCRWAVKPDDGLLNNEFCKHCAPWANRLVSAERQIRESDLAIIEASGKASREGRAARTIAMERLVEAESWRRVAREKLFSIAGKHKGDMKIAANKN